MGAAEWIAGAAALIAAASMVMAFLQAREARESRHAAQAQAAAARDAAEIAEAAIKQAQRSAAAAEQQVAIMREQLAAADAEHHERDAPQFTYEVEGSSNSVCPLKVTLHGGPSKLDVEVPWLGIRRAAEGNAGTFIEKPKTGQIHQITTGGTFVIDIDTRGYEEPMSATLELRCTEPGTERKWELSHTVQIPGSYRVEDSVF
ncbi:hypothetical protein [Lentzea nigeriaca]|uniref:hypothetical protein n=1 Tax=Lentzea nigeriaca TaxID=1128665 RepID=UPI00195BD5C1|nr:hypothetical protein [Lentzea nigeriaca]MBM7861800.1 hypothetical protein [Lentzea nigeriaca]